METKANYVIVGLFTIIAVVAAFAFVYWTATIGGRGETAPLKVLIRGSAYGLTPASKVYFNGVWIGDVKRVYLDVNDPTLAIADTEVARLAPITQSTKADITIAGLSGQANIELRGATADEPKLLDVAEESGTVAEITANPSAVTNLLETAQDIFNRADKILGGLEGFVSDVRQPLTSTIDNAQKFSQALADNSAGVDEFLASVTKLSGQLAGASDKLESALSAADGLLRAVDKDQAPPHRRQCRDHHQEPRPRERRDRRGGRPRRRRGDLGHRAVGRRAPDARQGRQGHRRHRPEGAARRDRQYRSGVAQRQQGDRGRLQGDGQARRSLAATSTGSSPTRPSWRTG